MSDTPQITVKNLTLKYSDYLVQENLNFDIKANEIFFIMGGSGCGKSTLLRHMVGLNEPYKGDVIYSGQHFWKASDEKRNAIIQNFGVMYQGGALWSSMTLAENISLPLKQHTKLNNHDIKAISNIKLSQVGLSGFGDHYPSEISGGMCKRAGIARAMALDPKILFFDEPSAGLDPVSSKNLDDLILQLRDSLGTTIVIVSHELPSIFNIADNSVFLDADTKTMIGGGKPSDLLQTTTHKTIQQFLTRGKARIPYE